MIEENKLIAEFMGAELTVLKPFRKSIYYPIRGKSYFMNKLKYHSSFNWLMDVIKKIESLKGVKYYFNCMISNSCVILQEGGLLTPSEIYFTKDITPTTTKKEAIYYCVIEFIKWYRKNY